MTSDTLNIMKDNVGIDEMKMLHNMKKIENEYIELKDFLQSRT